MRDLAAINGFVVFMSLIAFAAAWFFSGVIEIGVQFAAGCLAGRRDYEYRSVVFS